jgi:hypothetical protein
MVWRAAVLPYNVEWLPSFELVCILMREDMAQPWEQKCGVNDMCRVMCCPLLLSIRRVLDTYVGSTEYMVHNQTLPCRNNPKYQESIADIIPKKKTPQMQ